MANEDDDFSPEELAAARKVVAEHPALKKAGFNRTWEKTKYIGKKIIQFAAIGLLVGAVALPLMGVFAGVSLAGPAASLGAGAVGLFAKLGLPAAILGGLGLAKAGAFDSGAIAGTATGLANGFGGAMGALGAAGGVIGGVIATLAGVIAGFSGADKYVDTKQNDIIEAFDGKMEKQRQMTMLLERKQLQDIAYAKQAQALGIAPNPNMGLPGGERGIAGRGMG
jgi:hypothetical protein